MRVYNTFITFIEDFLFNKYQISEKYLALYRIFFCLFYLFQFGIADRYILGLNPGYAYEPTAIFGLLFQELPSPIFFHGLSFATVLCIMFVLFGYKTRLFSILLFFGLILSNTFLFSFGKISHGNILPLWLLLILSFSGWGNSMSVDSKMQKKYKAYPWAVPMCAFIIGFSFFTAAVPKVLGGWLNLDNQAAINNLYDFTTSPSFQERPLTEFMLSWDNTILGEIIDYLTIGFEAGFLLAVFFPLLFRIFVLAAISFHIFVYLTFDISFVIIMPTYLLFFYWASIKSISENQFLQGINKFVFNKYGLLISIIAFSVYMILGFFKNGNLYAGLPPLIPMNTLTVYSVAFFISVISIIFYLTDKMKSNKITKKTLFKVCAE